MKKFSTIILLLNCILSFSQIKITGAIVNQNNQAVELVELQLQNKDSLFMKSELTNSQGKFFLSVSPGEYLLFAKQLGKILYKQNLNATQNVNIGTIEITENKEQLKEVVVNSKKKLIERKVDRIVFNVENSISASGGDAIDALKVTPGISVQNDAISMIGKSGMAVMIDDRLMQLSSDDLINYLKTIKSDDIKSIEVITNPPAKYDAEGNSGIVNIKLKKAKADSWSDSFRSVYKQATYPTGSLGNSFNYQKNKVTLSTTINYSKGSNYTFETQKIEYPTQNWISKDDSKNYTNSISGKFSMDYKINNKITFGLQYLKGSSKPNVEQNNLATLTDVSSNLLTQNIQTNLFNVKKSQNNSLNFHTFYAIDTIGRKLSLDVDYFKFKKKNNQIFSTNDYDVVNSINSFSSINNLGNQDIENYSVKIDMEHPLKWVNLNYGSKLSFTRTDSNIEYFNLSSGSSIFDPSKSNQFKYKENNQALYFSATKKFGKDKWEVQFGLRLENTQTEGFSLTMNQLNKANYNKLFPTSYLTYTPNDDHYFSLNYGKRISRPRYAMLNPFRVYNNPYAYMEGNPFLQPSYTHNISFGHTLKNNLNTTISYSYENNGYSQITFIDPNSINQTTTMINHYKSENIGLSESYTFNKIKGWESYNSGSIYYNKTTSNNPNIQNITEGFGGYLSNNNSFVFNKNKTLLASLDVFYSFPNTSINTNNRSEFSTDLGFKYLLLNKFLLINFKISDIFRTNKQRWLQKIDNLNFYGTNYEDAQQFVLSISYKFGNNKLKTKEAIGGNGEEKDRVSGN